MTILVDVNLSPLWVPYFRAHGISFAAAHGHVLMTHDLDFGAMIASRGAPGPSVIQIRTQDVLPDAIGELVMKSLAASAAELEQGALVTITNERGRVRLLPFRRRLD